MTKESRSIRCPEGVLGWIPWYGEEGDDGSGVLTNRQRGAVEVHCAECTDCRAELDMISGAPYEIDVELPDADRVFGEITARIAVGEVAADANDQPTSVIPIGRARRLDEAGYGKLAAWILDGESETETSIEEPAAENVIRGPWGLSRAWAAAAAVLLLSFGGVGGMLLSQFSLVGTGEDVYELAAFEAPISSGVADTNAAGSASVSIPFAAPKVDVIFKHEASVRQISDLLRSAVQFLVYNAAIKFWKRRFCIIYKFLKIFF